MPQDKDGHGATGNEDNSKRGRGVERDDDRGGDKKGGKLPDGVEGKGIGGRNK